MTIAIAEALCALPNGSTSEIMVEVARNFISWRDSPENNRAPGLTCMSSVARLARGVPWDEAGSPNSKGCGAVMRVAPIGFLYQHRPEKLRGLATATALSTHAHPTALASACAAAYLIKLALDEVPLDSWIERTVDFVGKGSREISAKLRQVEAVLSLSSEETAMDQLGHGWVAEEAVALALYCVMRNPDSWLECVRRGANSPGDSDSIASIAGGIQAARLGLSAIPQNWQIAIERHQYLLNLSARLAKAKLQL
jgi:ADP-ribosylglycohydrolase